MTTVRQQPPPQVPSAHLYGRNHQPTPPHATVTPSSRSLDVGLRQQLNRDFRQDEKPTMHQPPPPRYAHPLQRAHSYSATDSAREGTYNGAKQSEHMLRRKTPNGILNAAYDGTSVEQAERPHAMKHILLPVTHQFASGPSSVSADFELPLRPPAQTWSSGYSDRHQSLMSSMQKMSNDFSNANVYPNSTWMLAQPHVPQIDSVLNQLPAHSTQYQFPHLGHPFGFMAPPMMPSFGPTASNDPGPFGPYWPNGTFVPYRPAALRDMRFYPQHTTAWAGFQTPSNPGTPGALWQNQHAVSLGSPGYFGSPKQFHGIPPSMDVLNAQALARLDSSVNRANSGYLGGSPHSLGLGLSGFPSKRGSVATTPRDMPDGAGQRDSGQTTPKAPSRKSSDAPSEFGEHSNNARLRERVLSHAHSVYVDLLRYLHELRKRNHRGSNQFVRTSMYPRPPRQPNCDFSNSASSSSTSQNRSSESALSTHSTNNGSHNSRFPRQSISNSHNNNLLQHSQNQATQTSSSTWNSNSSNYDKLERHQSWHNQPSHQAALNHSGYNSDRLRTLRRTSGSSLGLSHLPIRQEGSPTSNASAALENLTELCQESSWQWVDGMLLGGCLAYALADYQKALEWNTTILNIDSK